MKRYILSPHAGYCYGIQNAMDLAYAQAGKENVYMYGELSHNSQETERLESNGLKKIDSLDEIDSGTVIIRSHGVKKAELEKAKAKGLTVIDATCGYVKKLQRLIEHYSGEGYEIVIVGDKNHPEVLGAAGWSKTEPIIIDSLEEAKKFTSCEKLCIVAQTTMIEDLFDKIVEELQKKVRDTLVFNTICKATANRQKAAVETAGRVDAMIVVGGYHSSNTQKLKKLCQAHCEKTLHVETVQELDMKELGGLESVGITAGASTPDWLIEEVTEKLEENKFEQEVVAEEAPETVEEQTEEVVETEVSNEPVAEEVTEEAVEAPEVEAVQEEVVEKETEPEEEKDYDLDEAIINPLDHEEENVDENIDFASMVGNYVNPVHKNQVVEGEVIAVSDDEVILNIDYKSDAVIYKRDFTWKRDEDLQDLVKMGEKISAIVTDLNDGEGRVKLSKIKYDNQQTQERLGMAYEKKEILYGKVKAVSGSGLVVDVGFAEIFMPASQYHLHYVKDLESLVGNEVRGRIIDYNAKRRRAIFSQKVVLNEERLQRQKEQQELKNKRFEELQIGDIVKGKVKTITDFGVFIDLNGIDGFVHRSDLTWDRSNEPKNVVRKGQEIETKVISRNEEDKKIKLSVKALQEKPWDKFVKQFAANDEIDVVITNTLDFGAFAQIIPGVEGLIHISEISYDRVESVNSVLKPGQTVRVKIIGINPDKEKISLSIKATQPRPERYMPRSRRNDRDYDGFQEKPNRDRRRNRRQNSNKNRVFYEEKTDFTIGDSLGGILDKLDFNNYDDDYVEEDFDNTPVETEEVEYDQNVEMPEQEEILNPVLSEEIEIETTNDEE